MQKDLWNSDLFGDENVIIQIGFDELISVSTQFCGFLEFVCVLYDVKPHVICSQYKYPEALV